MINQKNAVGNKYSFITTNRIVPYHQNNKYHQTQKIENLMQKNLHTTAIK